MKALNSVTNIVLVICLLPLAVTFAKYQTKARPAKTLKDTIVTHKGFSADPVKYSASDSIVTNIEDKVIKLYGKACITNSAMRVNADYIEYNKQEKTGKAKGDVVLYNIEENVIAKSTEAVFKMK